MQLDSKALVILGTEHNHNQWIGPRLLSVANHCRSAGASFDDYDKWVRSSTLWVSYEGSTSDTATERIRNLERAWDKSFRPKPFDLHESLDELRIVVQESRWVGKAGNRDRAVALAFIDFCQEHNCFTRTISSYELAKWTPGFSPTSTRRGMMSLQTTGLFRSIVRTDRRVTPRSTRQWQLNLDWTGADRQRSVPLVVCATAPISTAGRLIAPPTQTTHDTWCRNGLGQSAGRVFDVIGERPVTVHEIVASSGLSVHQVRRAVRKLYEYGLVVKHGKRSAKYRRAEDANLDVVAMLLDVTGAIDRNAKKIVARQEANADLREYFGRLARR